jgi:ADP-ribosyl-[dinitrogen reductase] hydrolase
MSNVLLGTAIGDALGVPFETKLVNNPELIKWDGKTFQGSEHHDLKAGQYSDDTQMSMMVAESLIDNHGFKPSELAERYVDWIVSGRARGYGKTTLLAVNNLLEGKSYRDSGVAGSYGNGTAMRAAPIGVYFRNDLKEVVRVCKVDSAITHASEEAEAGSIAIAYAAALAAQNDTEDLLERIHPLLPDSKVKSIIYSLNSLVNAKHIPATAALRVLGTKADVRQTVPAALYCFLRFDNYHDAILAAIKAGGDTDTTAAIVGGLFGTKLGMKSIDPTFYGVEDFDRLVELDSQLYNRSNGSFLLTGTLSAR